MKKIRKIIQNFNQRSIFLCIAARAYSFGDGSIET